MIIERSIDISPVTEADASTFRNIWRGFCGTVAVITTEHDGKRFTMLATAVTSVSMDPVSLLICVNRSASASLALLERKAFSLGILSAQGAEIGAHIARAQAADRFDLGTWDRLSRPGHAADRLPWLRETQATLFCETESVIDHGTHTVIIATPVFAASQSNTDPLLYCEGAFGRFEPLQA